MSDLLSKLLLPWKQNKWRQVTMVIVKQLRLCLLLWFNDFSLIINWLENYKKIGWFEVNLHGNSCWHSLFVFYHSELQQFESCMSHLCWELRQICRRWQESRDFWVRSRSDAKPDPAVCRRNTRGRKTERHKKHSQHSKNMSQRRYCKSPWQWVYRRRSLCLTPVEVEILIHVCVDDACLFKTKSPKTFNTWK